MAQATLIDRLARAERKPFASWPDRSVPEIAAGVYSIWRGRELLYVGMSGRAATAEDIAARRAVGRRWGLWTRLNSHASGRRSGDQFCVYVADRLVLPTLGGAEIEGIAAGEISLDSLTREFVRASLLYTYVTTLDGARAHELERQGRRAGLGGGPPMLNPL